MLRKFMRRIALAVILAFLFSNCSTHRKSADNVMSWIKDSLSKELGIVLPTDALTIIHRFQFDTVHPVIIATVKVDQLNGGIFIYQWTANGYQLKYRKAEPIYNVQYNAGRHLVFESGFTGTGQKNTRFYLIEMNANFCTEIWSGAASEYNFTSVAPYHSVDGSVQLNSLDESFIYTTIDQTFLHTEFDLNKPDSIICQSEILRFRDLDSHKQKIKP